MKKRSSGEVFPGGPVVKTLLPRGGGSIPGWGIKIPHVARRSQENKGESLKKKKKKDREEKSKGRHSWGPGGTNAGGQDGCARCRGRTQRSPTEPSFPPGGPLAHLPASRVFIPSALHPAWKANEEQPHHSPARLKTRRGLPRGVKQKHEVLLGWAPGSLPTSGLPAWMPSSAV